MDKLQTITKDQVKAIMRSSKRGCEIAQACKAYFAANFKPPVVVTVTTSPDPIYEFAQKLFNPPVDNPGAGVGVGQASMLVPGP